MVWKRLVSVAKASGDVPEAIKRLNEYLKVFQSDTAAVSNLSLLYCCLPCMSIDFLFSLPQWQQLADLYILEDKLAMAAFCYEVSLIDDTS